MSGKYTTHPDGDEKAYEERCQDFLDGKCDSYGHDISNNESSDDKNSDTNDDRK